MTKRNSKHIKAQKEGKRLDEYMCFFCLDTFKGNHGHHIILYSEDGIASVNNMITLCPDCHRKYHSGKLNIEIGRF
jgi:5-methylcytosine-specific restriction endonuclease McrA